MVKPEDLAIFIIISMLFSFCLILGMVLLSNKNKKIQDLSNKLLIKTEEKKELEKIEAVILTSEKERMNIARQLHDDVGALLSIIHRNILKLKTKAKKGEVDIETIDYTETFVKDSIDQLRTITKGLFPYYLLKFGLLKAMERLGGSKSDSLNVKFLFKSNLNNDIEFSDVIQTHFYYISNELVTNLLKHSFPTSIEMDLNLERNQLILMIKHDGIALSQHDYKKLSQETENMGLENIRYRLKIIQGELSFKIVKDLGEIKLQVSI